MSNFKKFAKQALKVSTRRDYKDNNVLNASHNEQKKRLYILLLTLFFIFLANYKQIIVDCLVYDDYTFVVLHLDSIFVRLFRPRLVPFGGLINNIIFAYIFPYSVKLARIAIVFIGMVPVSLLFYYIYRNCFKMAYFPAFFASVLPHIIPGQIRIPMFINGSYHTYSMVPTLLFFISSYIYIDKKTGWPWLIISLLFLAISFFSTEIALFLCVPIFFSLFFLSKNKRSFYALTVLSFLLALFRMLLYFFWEKHTTSNAIQLSDQYIQYMTRVPGLIRSLALHNMSVYISYFMFFALLVWALIALFTMTTKRRVSLKTEEDNHEPDTRWLSIVVFGLLWLTVAALPFVLLQSGRVLYSGQLIFQSRYGYPAASGFSLLLVALPYHLVNGRGLLNRYLTVIFFILVTLVSLAKLQATNLAYGPSENLTQEVRSELSKREYPQDSQIMIVDERAGILLMTDGRWMFSSGFLQYNLKRKDVTGLIGPRMSFYNPFLKWRWDNSMVGLSANKPVFIYGLDPDGKKLLPIDYILQWLPENGHENWNLYRVDRGSGALALYSSGVGKDKFLREAQRLEKKGVSKSEIYGGD